MFFTFMTVTEGGGRRAVARKFQDVYLPALKANFMIWPAVQILNFRVIPLQFQIVSYMVASAGISTKLTTSPSFQPLVSLGRPICPLQTPPMSRCEPRIERCLFVLASLRETETWFPQ